MHGFGQTNAGGMGQSTWGEKMIMSGRLVCDTYIAAKENLRETTYTLAELARTQLGKTRQEVDFHQVMVILGFCAIDSWILSVRMISM